MSERQKAVSCVDRWTKRVILSEAAIRADLSSMLSRNTAFHIDLELTSARFPDPAYPLPTMSPSDEATDAAVLLPPT